MNWLVAMAVIEIDSYLVVALDRELYDFLRARGIPTVFSELRGDLSALWIRRVNIFSALCVAGIDFVHSDVDAIWIRDPRDAYLRATSGADLIISQGTVWPPDVHRQFGFVFCCGLFQMRSTAHTQRLLHDLNRHVQVTGDDQVSLNRLIAARAPRWQIEAGESYYVEGAGKRFLCARSVIHGTSPDGMRLEVLPHHLFQRVPVRSSEKPFVVHPLTPKDSAEKLKEFARCGCLLLRAEWRETSFDCSSLLRLRRAC
jgi:hypothetical protein